MKLRNTTTIALATLFALFTGLSHWLAYEATRDALQASVDKREADKVEAIGRFFDSLLHDSVDHLRLTARLTASHNRLGRELSNPARTSVDTIADVLDAAQGHSGVERLEITDRKEQVIYATGNAAQNSGKNNGWGIFEALQGDSVLASNIESGVLTLRSVEAVRHEDRIVGTLSAVERINSKTLERISRQIDAELALFSPRGKLMATSSGDSQLRIDAEALGEALQQKIAIYRHDRERQRIRVYLPINVVDSSFILVTDISSATAQRQLAQEAERAAWLAFGIVLLSLVLGTLILTWIMRPLGELRKRAEKIASELGSESGGDLLSTPSGDIKSVVHVLDSVTQRLVARNLELAHVAQQANAANVAKSAFIANMSHELRTPMNAIIGLTHIVARDSTDPTQRSKLDKVSRSADHLLQLLNNVLDLSKLDAESMTLEPADFSFGPLLQTLDSLLGERARAKGLALRMEVDDALRAQRLLGDALRLQQVLVNLVGNAIKFTDHGSIVVRVRIERESKASDEPVVVGIEVHDSGIGIADEALQRIFKPFEQADVSTTRQYGGTGLGLTISRRLVRLMGGDITVTSTPGSGCVFAFSLSFPRISSNEAPSKAAPLPTESAEVRLKQAFGGTRLLLAEDNAINREVIVDLLTDGPDLLVDIAEDGKQAVSLAAQNSYALILMDMQMPEMDGLEATPLIRQLPGYASVPIIALTANAFAEDQVLCMDAGMDDFLTKPLDPDVFYETLLKWLAK